jgi:hypothetical protein
LNMRKGRAGLQFEPIRCKRDPEVDFSRVTVFWMKLWSLGPDNAGRGERMSLLAGEERLLVSASRHFYPRSAYCQAQFGSTQAGNWVQAKAFIVVDAIR